MQFLGRCSLGALFGKIGEGLLGEGSAKRAAPLRTRPFAPFALFAPFGGGRGRGGRVGEDPGPAGVHAVLAGGDLGWAFGAFEGVAGEPVSVAGLEYVGGGGFPAVVEQVGAKPRGGVALLFAVVGVAGA